MPLEEIIIPNQGHTLACMLRKALFDNGAAFAACIVPHPQDEFLKIVIDAPDCKACLLSSLRDVRNALEQYTRVVASKKIHDEMVE